ncbi:hypothetical protein TELCIR_25503 [Teladorsagia circumcincta]|uniref:Uncharacterized protein n=1 Tax=Teladorsagia circumcincta TaxID=45464 RepID=A0A2G9T5E7_TELCI|nr:hypothetical protein TELCIR_25503 [Teladorsagia circumcincta]
MPVSASFSSFSTPKHRIHSRGSLSCVDSIREHSECLGQLLYLIWDSKAEHHGPNDVCPITAEAWTVLSAFLVNQVYRVKCCSHTTGARPYCTSRAARFRR